jgi:MFS family permease
LLILFSIAMFFGATLLFMVEPMFGKMALPLLGGSPAVWNTCMVFYQGALLAGYLYAHLAPKWLGVRRQAAFHLGLLLVILFTLPIGIFHGWTPPANTNPIAWLLLLLLLSVGFPFFVVSTTAPLLQKWFAQTSHAFAHDPYFLYGASNLGSLLALVAYPTIIEPYLRLHYQSWAWAGGYLVFIALLSLCGVMVWRASGQTGAAISRLIRNTVEY